MRACSYWRRADVSLFDSYDGTHRDDGTELHALAEAEISGDLDAVGGERARAMFERLRPVLDSIRASLRPGDVVLAEVSYGFHGGGAIVPARRIGIGLTREERDKLALPGEYVGTADLVVIRRNEAVEVYDHKTTYVGGEPMDARDQLATYAAVAALAEGADMAHGHPIFVTEESAEIDYQRGVTLDILALASELAAIRAELDADVAGAEPNPGPWCTQRYCKARASCPATSNAIERIIPADKLVRPYTPGQGYASAEQCAKGHVVRKLLDEAISAMKADERMWLEENGPVDFPDGSRLAMQAQSTERATLDIPGALDVLREVGAGAAVKATVAWSDIKKIGPDVEKAARDGLREIGAVRVSAFTKPVLRTPRRKPPSVAARSAAFPDVEGGDE